MHDYQREKDGYPDVAECQECGVYLNDDLHTLCECCDWDLHGDEGAEET